ncbi:hypothetical protein MMC2321_03491 [Chitinophaga sp. MM2321]
MVLTTVYDTHATGVKTPVYQYAVPTGPIMFYCPERRYKYVPLNTPDFVSGADYYPADFVVRDR